MTTKIKLTTALAVLCAGLSLFAAETQFTQNGILINNGSWVDIGNLSNGTPNATPTSCFRASTRQFLEILFLK